MNSVRFLGALAFLLVSGGAALAHAIVLASTPRANETLKGDPIALEIRFNSRIDVARSSFKLFKVDGETASLPLSPESSEDTLKATAKGLAPGAYRLHWQTLSLDGHITQGDIPFAVSR